MARALLEHTRRPHATGLQIENAALVPLDHLVLGELPCQHAQAHVQLEHMRPPPAPAQQIKFVNRVQLVHTALVALLGWRVPSVRLEKWSLLPAQPLLIVSAKHVTQTNTVSGGHIWPFAVGNTVARLDIIQALTVHDLPTKYVRHVQRIHTVLVLGLTRY